MANGNTSDEVSFPVSAESQCLTAIPYEWDTTSNMAYMSAGAFSKTGATFYGNKTAGTYRWMAFCK